MKSVFVVALLFFMAGTLAFPEKIGTLNVSSETVFFKENVKNDYKQISGIADIFMGTTIRTEHNGTASVQYPEIAEISIKKDTIATFNKSSIEMKVGKASYKFVKKGHRFTVQLPVAIIGVLGTEFDIEVKKDKSSSVKMKSGVISLKTAKGEYTVEKGNIASIAVSGSVEIKRFALIPPMNIRKPVIKTEPVIVKEPVPVEVPSEPPKEEPKVKDPGIVDFEMIGDLDQDGKITNFDIGILNKYIQKNPDELTPRQKRISDVDGNGKIDNNDLIKMQIFLEYHVDLNNDGKIDQNDIDVLKDVVKYEENKQPCDINRDGSIDVFDINELQMIVEQLKGCSIGVKK